MTADWYNNSAFHNISSKPANRESCKICKKFVYYHQPILFCNTCRNIYHGTCLKFTNDRVFALQQTDWNCAKCCNLNLINYNCETCYQIINLPVDKISICNRCRKLLHYECSQRGLCLTCSLIDTPVINVNDIDEKSNKRNEIEKDQFFDNQPYFCPFDFYDKNFAEFLPDVDNLSDQISICNSVLKSCRYFNKNDFVSSINSTQNNFMGLNIDGVRTNFDEFLIFNREFNSDKRMGGYFLCETNVTDVEAQTFYIEGYNKFVQDRIYNKNSVLKHKGSGLITFLNNSFSRVKTCSTLCKSTLDFECLTLEVIDKNTKYLFMNAYRSPSGNFNKFLENFGETLELASNFKDFKTFVFGDLNVNLYNPSSSKCRDYLSCIFSNGFLPMISRATHFAGERATCIDHILCNDTSDVKSSYILRVNISHHLPVCINLNIGSIDGLRENKKPRIKINDYLVNKFIDDLRVIDSNINVDCTAEECFSVFIEEFKNSYDKCFIESNSDNSGGKYKQVLRKDWITIGLAKSCATKQDLYENFKADRNKYNWDLYIDYSRKLDRLKNKAKFDYYCRKFDENKDDLKKTWRLINNLLGRKRFNKLLTFPEEDAAHNFNKYFTSVASDLVKNSYPNETQDGSFYKYLGNFNIDENSCLKNVIFDEKDILYFISNLSNSKTTYFAPKVLKLVSRNLSNILCKLFNKCASEGYFPKELKVAKVIPLFKNKGDINDIGNYRPISMLPVFSKIFEKLIHKTITEHLDSNNILNDSQYGFRKKRSTLHALLDATENIYKSVDKKLFTLGIFIDYSRAFDVIDHSILLKKLSHYGIRGKILELLECYLSNRKQYVSYGGKESTLMTVKCGVPQGSVLGPLLFIIFVNDIINISKLASFILFADDLNIFVAHTCRSTAYTVANQILIELYNYCVSNRLIINFSKCCFIEFGNSSIDSRQHFHLGILNNQFKKVEKCKFLGVCINSSLNWNDQIDQVICQVSKSCGTMFRTRLHVPRKILRSIYLALIQPYLLYCIALWGSSFNSDKLNKLFILQKKCVRIVAGKTTKVNGIFAHTKPIFRSLNILTVFNLYTYFTATETMKIISTGSPVHLRNNFQVSERSVRLLIPKFEHESLKRISFTYNGSKIINHLLNCDIPYYGLSISVFKSRLKIHLLTMQSRSRPGDAEWLQCNHDIFSDIIV